jgi:[NiFe] hydrogenase diaphorase moiety large subunit
MESKQPNQVQDRTDLLNCLWNFQNQNGYISDEDVKTCSRSMNLSQIEVEGVISFYHFFHRQPSGKFTIYLNNSIVSVCKGFDRIKESFERETGASFGGVDPSNQFGLFETACIGLSDMEPAALINFYPFTNLNTLKVKSIIAQLKRGASPADICDEVPNHVHFFPEKGKSIFFRDYQPGNAVTMLRERTPEEVIEEVKKSKLSGMGGAFFPAGMKWEFCRNQEATPKYIVCNADEGEPGTFKDRVLMNAFPGLVLEGMIVAGYAVGAKEGILYLRAEYKWLYEKLDKTIEQFRKMNLLGKNVGGVRGFDFDIRIQLGAGAYVCGEETALLNSMEGLRGEPRTKLFFPTEKGFLHKPTVVNNVETLCAAARILELGADYFLNTGIPSCPGTKLLSISGDCRKPGIYEIEWGTKIGDVLELCGADDPYYIQVSGPSGQCVSMSEVDRVISKDDIRCGGSFMIFNSSREILDILINFSEFFKSESCGVCTPCRAGNFIIQRKLDRISRKLAYQSDYDEVREWGNIMKITSRCGLGKMATNTLLMALDKFPKYFDSKVDHHKEGLNKEFDIESSVAEYEKFCN